MRPLRERVRAGKIMFWGERKSDILATFIWTVYRTHKGFYYPLLLVFGEGNGTPLQYFAWKIPGMEEPGRLQSMGSLRVGHDWVTSLSLFTSMHWRRKWQPTPVFLPGESQGRGSLVAAVCGITQSRTRLKALSSSSYSPISKQHPTRGRHSTYLQWVNESEILWASFSHMRS